MRPAEETTEPADDATPFDLQLDTRGLMCPLPLLRLKKGLQTLVSGQVVHVLATDAHTTGRRKPVLSEGVAAAARIVGKEEARRMVMDRPRHILDNRPPSESLLPVRTEAPAARRLSLLRRWFGLD